MKIIMVAYMLAMAIVAIEAEDYQLSDLGSSPSETRGWVWESFADRVMGGKSELPPPAVIEAEGGKALLLAGKVITKGGGFIQVRLKYGNALFDATAWSGVEVEVDSPADGSYFVFLRTKDNVFPWSYYGAELKPTARRSKIRIPWSAFEAESTGKKEVRSQFLSSVALVAAFKDFNAYLRIYSVKLYK
jgi:hypothetical protein